MPDSTDRATYRLSSGPENSPGFWLYHAVLAWQALIERRLNHLGLTQPQFMVLSVTGWLSRHGNAPSQQEVAEQAGIDRMLTSRLVRRLEQSGYLARTSDPSDARLVRVSLTVAGRVAAAQAIEIVREIDENVFGLTPTEMQVTLKKLAQRLRQE